ncbi:MAG: c-type cytochrome [Gammaproteobacteria bacterium]
MTHPVKLSLVAVLAVLVSGRVPAVELPAPKGLSATSAVHSRKVTVVEPHVSTKDRQVLIDYTALPMDALLTHWFGDNWKSEDAEVFFFARDGYRSVAAGSKLKKYRSYLAFARDDGAPFVVDNLAQNEKQIPLGPYYLIWQNQGIPGLLRQGGYGWPYQITAVELHSKTEYQALLPPNLSKKLEQGFADTKEYCLTCHHIRGIGGKKHPVDLVKAACRWPQRDLKSWIEYPGRMKPGTTMPPLGRTLPAKERRQIIERIAGYLNAMESEQSEPCIEKMPAIN